MDRDWSEYFKEYSRNKSIVEYAHEHWKYHSRLYSRILNLLNTPSKILEIGCGSGFSSIYLQEIGMKVTAVDKDMKVVDFARNNAKNLNSDVTVEQGDIFDLSKYYSKYDMIFSAGVLEHFEKEVFIKLLKEQSKCATYTCIVIPTKYLKYGVGIIDEKIYSASQVENMYNESGLEVVLKFGYGDVPGTYCLLRDYLLPQKFCNIFQNKFFFSMNMGFIGKVNK